MTRRRKTPGLTMFAGLKGSTNSENADPAPKLLLRRHFLDTYHPTAKMSNPVHADTVLETPRVFDACQAGGLLWTELRKEYRVKYWGVDLKPQKKGTLKIDSARILEQPGHTFDVVDIDTYGAPWHHWLVMLPHVRKPLTVFLTMGRAGGPHEVGNDALSWLGLDRLIGRVPAALRWKLADYASETLLAAPMAFGLTIVEAMEATATRNARYIGLRLEPQR